MYYKENINYFLKATPTPVSPTKEVFIKNMNQKNFSGEVHNFVVVGSDWCVEEVLESDISKEKVESSGRVGDLDKVVSKKETNLIAMFLCITICFILSFSVVWGAWYNNWIPLDRSKDIVALMGSFIMVIKK